MLQHLSIELLAAFKKLGQRGRKQLYTDKRALWAKNSAIAGSNETLITGMKAMYDAVLSRLALADSDVQVIYVSGMATSPYGFKEMPHCIAPVSLW